jgi:hypothetical protein
MNTRDLAETLLLQTAPHDEDEVWAVCRALIESERQRHEAEDLLRRIYRMIPAGNAPTDVESRILAAFTEPSTKGCRIMSELTLNELRQAVVSMGTALRRIADEDPSKGYDCVAWAESEAEHYDALVARIRAEHKHNEFSCPAHARDCSCPSRYNTQCNPYWDPTWCPDSIEIMTGECCQDEASNSAGATNVSEETTQAKIGDGIRERSPS